MSSKEKGDTIATPHEHDVLSGRGNFVNYHAGNEYFRALVQKHKVAYVACPKPQKGKFSQMIVDEIKSRDPPGRFLKQDAKSKLWYNIGEKKALDKTRQALREGAPDIQKELGGDVPQATNNNSNNSSSSNQSSPCSVGSTSSPSYQPQTVSAVRRPSHLNGSFSLLHVTDLYVSNLICVPFRSLQVCDRYLI